MAGEGDPTKIQQSSTPQQATGWGWIAALFELQSLRSDVMSDTTVSKPSRHIHHHH